MKSEKTYVLGCDQCSVVTRHRMAKPRRGRFLSAKSHDRRLLAQQSLSLGPMGDTLERVALCLGCGWKRRYGLEAMA